MGIIANMRNQVKGLFLEGELVYDILYDEYFEFSMSCDWQVVYNYRDRFMKAYNACFILHNI